MIKLSFSNWPKTELLADLLLVRSADLYVSNVRVKGQWKNDECEDEKSYMTHGA